MRNALVTLVVLGLASGAWGVNYTWVSTNTVNTGTMGDFTNPLSWDQGVGFPSTAADNVLINVPGTLVDLNMGGSGAITFTMGQFIMNAGSIYSWYRPITFNVTASGSSTGDFIIRSAANGSAYGQAASTWNIDGNFWNLNPSNFIGTNYNGPFTINMNGNNKAMRWAWSGSSGNPYNLFINLYGTGIWDNNSLVPAQSYHVVDVKPGAGIGSSPTFQGNWSARQFIFESGQGSLPALKSNVNFWYGCAQLDNGPLTKNFLTVTGGVIYPQDVNVGAGYWGSGVSRNPYYVWRMKGGDLTAGQDFKFQSPLGGSPGQFYFSTEENSTNGATFRNITAYRDVTIGSAGATETYLFKLNSSTLTVGRNLTVGSSNTNNSGSLDLGSGTVRLGGNLTVWQPSAWTTSTWNPGTSTIVCTGNGTAYHLAQVIQTWGECGTTLNNLTVNNAGGAVSLFNGAGGTLRLTGNLEVDCGTFTGNKRPIIFTAGSHALTNNVNPAGYQFDDNINLLSGAVLTLGSNVTVKSTDNLILGSGSSLYLNGFLLAANGQSWVSGQVSPAGVAYEGGLIFGTMTVPEASTWLLLGTGALGTLGYMRRRKMV